MNIGDLLFDHYDNSYIVLTGQEISEFDFHIKYPDLFLASDFLFYLNHQYSNSWAQKMLKASYGYEVYSIDSCKIEFLTRLEIKKNV